MSRKKGLGKGLLRRDKGNEKRMKVSGNYKWNE